MGWDKTVWQIDKHAIIEMGFMRKNRQLIFGLERNRREIKKSIRVIHST